MSQSIFRKQSCTATAQLLAKMREQLISIGEKERILRERSASREVFRYLLDAHRLTAWPNADEDVLDIPPIEKVESNQLGA